MFIMVQFKYISKLYNKMSDITKLYYDFSELNFMIDFDKKSEFIKNKLSINPSEILGIGLQYNKMTTDQFINLSNLLPLKEFTSLKVLNISDNKIDANITPILNLWLSLPSKPNIKMTGTILSCKNIKTLADQFRLEYPNKVSNFIKHIIFVSEEYINKADSLDFYKQLINDGKISLNWADKHHKFYNSVHYKNLTKIQEWNKYQMVERQMAVLGHTRYNINKKLLYNDNSENDTLDFSQVLDLVTFHW